MRERERISNERLVRAKFFTHVGERGREREGERVCVWDRERQTDVRVCERERGKINNNRLVRAGIFTHVGGREKKGETVRERVCAWERETGTIMRVCEREM